MDLYEAIGLLGLESFVGSDYSDYRSKDVEKCFRQKALRHHPDKGGDASYFQLLQRAKSTLLEHNSGNKVGRSGTSWNSVNDANSIALSASLYEHRTCIRQVLVVHGKNEAVIAATDDGLVVTELKKGANYCALGDLQRIVSFTTHRNDCSFLCCAAPPSISADIIYAGAKDGFIHRIALSKRSLTSWQLPSHQRVVATSTIENWVAVATSDGGLYILEYIDNSPTPSMVWKSPVRKEIVRETGTPLSISPETILLQQGASSHCLNLWVGGSGSENLSGKLLMWELDIEQDLFEQYSDETEDVFCGYSFDDSDTDTNNKDQEDCYDKPITPTFDLTVEEGPIFSLSKQNRTIAVTSGQCIVVWEYIDNTSPHRSGKELRKIKTIKTNNQTLYALCMNEFFIAAAGSGESIMVWDRDLWTMMHYLPLQRPPSSCCLATSCIMTLDWFHQKSGILVSGGYDGVVTIWTLANRLK